MEPHIKEILDAYHSSPPGTAVYVGTDSMQSKYYTSFVTVVILHYGVRLGTGKGCKIFAFVEKKDRINSLKQKLLEEVNYSMMMGIPLMYGDEITEGIPASIIEIHCDINTEPRHKSHIAYAQALAYVKGQGMIHKFKPHALAASSAADFYLRRGREQNKSSIMN